MAFTLVKGRFRPAAGIPDGDSVRFEPDDADLMRSIPRVRMPPNATTVQLRFEGIDALEKHAIQPHANDARDFNLRLLGTQGVNDAVGARGYILTREGDKKSGRPVCFVYPGATDEDDGANVFLRAERVRGSVNFQLMQAGMVYPLFYETLFKELREVLVEALVEARDGNRGYIVLDESAIGVAYAGPHALGDLPPIFPKLFAVSTIGMVRHFKASRIGSIAMITSARIPFPMIASSASRIRSRSTAIVSDCSTHRKTWSSARSRRAHRSSDLQPVN